MSTADDELERALIEFYAAILIYLSKAKNYFQENSASVYLCSTLDYQLIRILERIIKSGLLAKSDLESYFQNIIKMQEIVDRCSALVNMRCEYQSIGHSLQRISGLTGIVQIDAHEEMKRLLEQMDSPMQRLSDELRNIKDGLDSKLLVT
jgi:hypothetical protein